MKKKFVNLVEKTIWFLAVISLLFIWSCNKDHEIAPNTTVSEWTIQCKNAVAVGDTFHLAEDITSLWVVKNIAGANVVTTWNFGDGTPTITGQLVSHIWVSNGVYTIMATFTPPGGNQTTITAIVKIGLQGSKICLVLLNSSIVSGTSLYHYDMAAWPGVIYNYANLTGYPWWCGTTIGWFPHVSIVNTIVLNGETWLPFSFERLNGQENMQYGRDNSWSYGLGYANWRPDLQGVGGTWLLNCHNGQIDSTAQAAFQPGLAGDPLGNSPEPTIRYDFVGNQGSNSDSLVIYFNNSYSNNNVDPFVQVKYQATPNWILLRQKLIPGESWGYLKLALTDIIVNGNILYFEFGPNYNNPAVIANMTNSGSFISNLQYCGVQTAGPIQGARSTKSGLALRFGPLL